ncbi:NAD(P)H-dependent oxidoreductase [Cellulomonas persica]|uniref:NAD(P)H-dependent oxidoreductase n=1 Tax=Cellulomonas persica TaxID=76861 RepID=UPI0011BE897C|nr:NAD(P)H-dependent oxidoreductase [Cellulomonas persica]
MSTQTVRPTVVVVSGNPREGSRTLGAAQQVAAAVAAHVAGEVTATIDLAGIAAEILTSDHPRADAARTTLADADVAVVATPVYKASSTGLLKAFLDLYGPDGLAGVVVVPLVVSGNPAHALVGEVHLRPVLVELGAVVPTRALSVTEADPGLRRVVATALHVCRRECCLAQPPPVADAGGRVIAPPAAPARRGRAPRSSDGAPRGAPVGGRSFDRILRAARYDRPIGIDQRCAERHLRIDCHRGALLGHGRQRGD